MPAATAADAIADAAGGIIEGTCSGRARGRDREDVIAVRPGGAVRGRRERGRRGGASRTCPSRADSEESVTSPARPGHGPVTAPSGVVADEAVEEEHLELARLEQRRDALRHPRRLRLRVCGCIIGYIT